MASKVKACVKRRKVKQEILKWLSTRSELGFTPSEGNELFRVEEGVLVVELGLAKPSPRNPKLNNVQIKELVDFIKGLVRRLGLALLSMVPDNNEKKIEWRLQLNPFSI